jgi:transcriptional regulator GlxA family with amidase domain
MSAVARACGYGHEKSFFRHFRGRTGLTPGTWRSRKRNRRQGDMASARPI